MDSKENERAVMPPGWRASGIDSKARENADDLYSYFHFAIAPLIEAHNRFLTGPATAPAKESEYSGRWLKNLEGEVRRDFALALQGRWERQFRRWLRDSACVMLMDGYSYAEGLKRASIEKLEKSLKKIRNVNLEDIPEGRDLLELLLVGNVARHGDGPSVKKLLIFRPEPWRNEAFGRPDPNFDYLSEDELTDYLVVSPEDIQRYAVATIMFWQRVAHSSTFENRVAEI